MHKSIQKIIASRRPQILLFQIYVLFYNKQLPGLPTADTASAFIVTPPVGKQLRLRLRTAEK